MADINSIYTNACRACLKTNVLMEYEFYKNISSELYYFCTSITVQEDDTFPKGLCESCHNSLVKYSKFKRICLNSQSTLLHNYSMKQENNTNTDDFTPWDNDTVTDDPLNLIDKEATKPKKRLNKTNCIKKLTFECKLCKKKFKHKDVFEAHSLEHEGKIVKKSCATCNKVFMTWSGLKRHTENEHSIVKLGSLKCPFCGKIFKNKQTLNMHKTLHGPIKKGNVCNVCGKGLSSYISLKNHLEIHSETRERIYACETCGKNFFNYKALQRHLNRTHLSNKKFICHYCNFPFTEKYNLVSHLLAHEGRKTFKCEICSKTFSRQSTLNEHNRSHTGEKPFQCDYCPKSFAVKRSLIDHHKTHTGEKSHKCEICKQCFSQRSSLVRHMKIHNN